MSGTIYLLADQNQLVEMNESPYSSEDLLQTLLADYPNLLAGDQMDSDDPRRWLLIRREMSLPSSEGGSGRWSVDHLFLDHEGIPTIIEVKRGTDTRIRREVIGQMLEYAANAVVYWPVESMRAQFEASCELTSRDPEQVLDEFLDGSMTSDVFWQTVKTNLQAGKVRLVFVADLIPSELRRVVEFLNVQMSPAEVLAVEIRQYIGQGQRALVPRVIGQTEQALQKKTSAANPKTRWDEGRFFEALERNQGPPSVVVAREILDWAKRRNLDIWWGRGLQDGSFFPMRYHQRGPFWTVSVWTYGSVEIQFGKLSTNPPFSSEDLRISLADRLNQIPGVQISLDRITKRPNIRLEDLQDEASRSMFFSTLDWVVDQIETIIDQ